MAKRSFIDEFDIKEENIIKEDISDYDTFQNKNLLEELRNKIIQNLIDNDIQNHESMDDFVKLQIDKTLEGYDLSSDERNYIYNLIDNEISGYGPLTELLKDKEITEIWSMPKMKYILNWMAT